MFHSRRRTVSLIVKRDGSLVVRAPKRLGKEEITKIINKKKEWIEKSVRKMKALTPAIKEFRNGEIFLYLGKGYPLRLINNGRVKLKFDGEAFYLFCGKAGQGKKIFTQWYVKQAQEVIFPRARHFAEIMGVKYRRISITSANTRWGSCGSHGTVNFSWRLVLAPPDIIDSVIVHELAHLLYHDHSKKFWGKVHEFYPDYKQAREWLNKNGHKLQI